MIAAAEVVHLASERTFNAPLVTNVFRSILVEAMVSAALPDWSWCSADYAAYDFEHQDKTRLEVKQTALRQTWVSKNPSPPSWDIKARTGAWKDGNEWVPRVGRNADIYVLALHPVTDAAADHRDPSQWLFYVLAAVQLPNTQRLSVSRANEILMPVTVGELAGQVQQVADRFLRRRQ